MGACICLRCSCNGTFVQVRCLPQYYINTTISRLPSPLQPNQHHHLYHHYHCCHSRRQIVIRVSSFELETRETGFWGEVFHRVHCSSSPPLQHLFFCLSLSVSICLSPSLIISVSFSQYLSLSLCLRIPVPVSVSLSPNLCLALSRSLAKFIHRKSCRDRLFSLRRSRGRERIERRTDIASESNKQLLGKSNVYPTDTTGRKYMRTSAAIECYTRLDLKSPCRGVQLNTNEEVDVLCTP